MVRRRSTVRFRKGAPAQRRISNSGRNIRGLVHGLDARFGVLLPPWPPPAKVTLRSCPAGHCGSRSTRARTRLRLAALSYEVYGALKKSRGPDKDTVGPRSIVVWRSRRDGPRNGGGGQQFYTETARDRDSPGVPSIGNGMDVLALGTILMEQFQRRLAKNGFDFTSPPPDLDNDEITRRLAALPDDPDEKLR